MMGFSMIPLPGCRTSDGCRFCASYHHPRAMRERGRDVSHVGGPSTTSTAVRRRYCYCCHVQHHSFGEVNVNNMINHHWYVYRQTDGFAHICLPSLHRRVLYALPYPILPRYIGCESVLCGVRDASPRSISRRATQKFILFDVTTICCRLLSDATDKSCSDITTFPSSLPLFRILAHRWCRPNPTRPDPTRRNRHHRQNNRRRLGDQSGQRADPSLQYSI